MAITGTKQMSKELEKCINDCLDCYKVCVQTASYCLEKGGKHVEAGHIKLLKDCIDACLGSTGFMLRNSDWSGQACSFCADICMKCATDCDSFDDEQMKKCADVCRRCADSCRKMADMAAQRV
ncbi:MAG: four-helix bundle copper-binding protein [Candidatus Jettenia sp.]|nr:four-helix bundle copper-binding protein [Candidatus Jettenia sp. AMX1]MBC6927923.1 four-helix bundle copper-binding protein [Candidatus Jettenia sp.]NUN21851.1 four-helix bundle copper-binding protein [Candidatus Jettenia caeni]KAA0248244.1 MAG: four-helix bundle copper-binding protein [Candidatus Jettenia sp. AMX1]MCE7879526.1 four-helix bundle copper-binding protein [Candidatus Jettenia sp. AMX1]MDL1937850.1 four-helix bundle copper-binding protein [Candidatus Jettenia sp. AMX1]